MPDGNSRVASIIGVHDVKAFEVYLSITKIHQIGLKLVSGS